MGTAVTDYALSEQLLLFAWHVDPLLIIMCFIFPRWQVLKLYAWEESFQKKILEVRAKELVTLRKVAYLTAWTALSWLMAPYLVGQLTRDVDPMLV